MLEGAHPGELSTVEWCAVIDQLAELGFLKANFTGGEPLLRRDLIGLLARATSAGIPELHLNTNALLLDERRLDGVLGAGVRSFNISVDGPTAGVHDAVRGRDARSSRRSVVSRRSPGGARNWTWPFG